jgi:hypothetical protein
MDLEAGSGSDANFLGPWALRPTKLIIILTTRQTNQAPNQQTPRFCKLPLIGIFRGPTVGGAVHPSLISLIDKWLTRAVCFRMHPPSPFQYLYPTPLLFFFHYLTSTDHDG